MAVEILTRQDLENLKTDIIQEIRSALEVSGSGKKEVLKSADVRKMLGISHGTLQTLRINGTLPFSKVGGTIFYQYKDVMKVLQQNKNGSLPEKEMGHGE
ncbi:MAG: helix-turn-helix domain-containing protein [Bacteroidetes bacterium]|nr:helix-turn-helix domain-containing protein [Bacteroidota bacterium]